MTNNTIKLPKFDDDVKQWLVLVDAFLSNLYPEPSDTEKYGALLSSLPVSRVKDVEHILADPPRTNKFAALQDALKASCPPTNDNISFWQLLSMKLDDQTPSKLLLEMNRINNARKAKLPSPVIRSIHLEKMPPELQIILESVSTHLTDKEYTATADRVYNRSKILNATTRTIASTRYLAQPSSIIDRRIANLEEEIRRLEALLRSNNHHSINEQTPRQNNLCFYHKKFGEAAINCKQPCGRRYSEPVKQDCHTASSTTSTINNMLQVSDISNARTYLIDTGSAVSLLPASDRDRKTTPAYNLLAVNDSKIATFGTTEVHVALSSQANIPWKFIIADVQQPILGWDFLHTHNFTIDARRNELTHQPTASIVHATNSKDSSITKKEPLCSSFNNRGAPVVIHDTSLNETVCGPYNFQQPMTSRLQHPMTGRPASSSSQ